MIDFPKQPPLLLAYCDRRVSFEPEKVASFGQDTPMERPGQPAEVAPAYVFLASEDALYMTGQVIHVNGGTVINS